MARDCVLVTGGNSGIGFECARSLEAEGWQVVIASRDRELSARAARRISQRTGNGAVSELGLDLGSPDSVREFVGEVESRRLPIRALVCNAGLQFNSGPRLSPEGFELTFAVNHLGHFLLTNLLLGRLLDHAPARIVVVSSGVHDASRATGMPKPRFPDLETLAATGGAPKGEFDGRLAYVNSKLCNLWFAYELVRRIEAAGLSSQERPLSVNAWEPGLVPGSGLAREYPAALRFVWDWVMPPLARVMTSFVPSINPASKSGHALARVVLDPSLERISGRYFPSHSRWREAPSSDESYDAERARDLWEESVRMTGLRPEDSALARA